MRTSFAARALTLPVRTHARSSPAAAGSRPHECRVEQGAASPAGEGVTAAVCADAGWSAAGVLTALRWSFGAEVVAAAKRSEDAELSRASCPSSSFRIQFTAAFATPCRVNWGEGVWGCGVASGRLSPPASINRTACFSTASKNLGPPSSRNREAASASLRPYVDTRRLCVASGNSGRAAI